MVERIGSTRRGRDGRNRGRRGGRRPGAGRKVGSTTEIKSVARAVAARTDKLPHELLLEWALSGSMRYPGGRTVQLDASERIACAKGCASWYKPPYQARQAPGEQPPVMRVVLDEQMLSALSAKKPDQLELLRDVLKAISAGGADPARMVAAQSGETADAARYASMLTADSETAGQA